MYPFFFAANGVMRPRRIPNGNYGLVATVGTTFYAITRLCFTVGALTHLLLRDVRRFTTAYLFDNFAVDRYKRRRVFSLGENTCVIERNTDLIFGITTVI